MRALIAVATVVLLSGCGPLVGAAVLAGAASGGGGGGGGGGGSPSTGSSSGGSPGAPDTSIGPSGGELAIGSGSLAGARLLVPAGALGGRVTFTAVAGTAVAVAPDVAVGPAVRFEPPTTFAAPVSVRIPFGALPLGRVAGEVFVAKRDDASGQITSLAPSSVDAAGGLVTVQVTSLSTFQAALHPPIPPGPGPLGVTGLTIDPERPRVGETATLSWSISGAPTRLVLTTPLGRTDVTGTSRIVTPFPAAPAGLDPRTSFRVTATDASVSREQDAVTVVASLEVDLALRAVAALDDGGAVAVGHLRGTATVAPGITLTASGHDVLVLRLDAQGHVVWGRVAGGADSDVAENVAVVDGSLIVVTGAFIGGAVFGAGEAGATTLQSAGGADGFVAAYRLDGSLAWARSFGGESADSALAVAAVPGGAVLVAAFQGAATFAPGAPGETTLSEEVRAKTALVCFRADGSLAWVKATGGAASLETKHLAAFPDGSTALVGFVRETTTFGPGEVNETVITEAVGGAVDGFVARFAPDGGLVFARRLGRAAQADHSVVPEGVAALADGSIVVAGQFQRTATFATPVPTTLTSTFGSTDIFVAGITPAGDVAWVRKAGGGGSDNATGMVVLPDGEVAAWGTISGAATFGAGEPDGVTLPAGSPETRFYVARWRTDGSFSRVVDDPRTISRLDALPTGALVAVGDRGVLRIEPVNYAVVEARPSGFAWARAATCTAFDVIEGVAPGPDGDAYACGRFLGAIQLEGGAANPVSFPDAQETALLARYGGDGRLVWARRATSTGGLARAFGVAAFSTGGACVAGDFNAALRLNPDHGAPIDLTGGSNNAFIARYDASGDAVWGRAPQHPADGSYSTALAAAAWPDGSAALVGIAHGTAVFGAGEVGETTTAEQGTATPDLVAARYDPDGRLAWARRVTDSIPYGAAVSADGGLLVAGAFEVSTAPAGTTLSSAGERDVLVVKYDASGTPLWARRAGGARFDEAHDITALPDGGFAVCGNFVGTATFGPGEPHQTTLTAIAGGATFVARCAPDGSLVWVRKIDGFDALAGDAIVGAGIAAVPGGLIVLGQVRGNATFGQAEPGEYPFMNGYVARYDLDGTFTDVERMTGTVLPQGIAAFADGSAVIGGALGVNTVSVFGGDAPNARTFPAHGEIDLFTAKFFAPPPP